MCSYYYIRAYKSRVSMVAISEAETPIGKQRRKVEIQEALESHLASLMGCVILGNFLETRHLTYKLR